MAAAPGPDGSIALTPEMLTLTSIVSVKIQTCVTRFDEKKKKCVRSTAVRLCIACRRAESTARTMPSAAARRLRAPRVRPPPTQRSHARRAPPTAARRYTAFMIELKTHGGLVWSVERRFSQFHTLNNVLKLRYAELQLFKFPPKRWFSSFTTQTVEQRRRIFEVYLQELLCLQPRPVELNNFLDINAHIWGLVMSQTGGQLGGGAAAGAAAPSAAGSAGAVAGSMAPSRVVGSAAAAEEFIARLQQGNVGLDDFELLRVLGKGSFGKVFLVRLIATGQVYALKVLKKSEVVRRRQVEHTKAERRIMGGIDHPFVVALRFAFQTADKLYMVTDCEYKSRVSQFARPIGNLTHPRFYPFPSDPQIARAASSFST